MKECLQRMLLDEKQLAKIINRSVRTLRNDRCQGRGLPYVKIGGSIRYSLADVERYLKRRRINPESEETSR